MLPLCPNTQFLCLKSIHLPIRKKRGQREGVFESHLRESE